MKLIPEAEKWYRMFSVQAILLVGSIQLLIASLPNGWVDHRLPFAAAATWHQLGDAATIFGAVLAFIGRLIDQGHVTQPPDVLKAEDMTKPAKPENLSMIHDSVERK